MKSFYAVAGLLGGLFWISIRFFPSECFQITEVSEVLCNRLWSPALLGMFLGFFGLFSTLYTSQTQFAYRIFSALPIGFAFMFCGNVVEYWMLNNLPHQGPNGFTRGLAWMTVLFGFFIVLVASTIAGIVGFKLRCIPGWLCALLLLLFPLTIVIGLLNMDFAGIPVGVVSVGVGLSALDERFPNLAAQQPRAARRRWRGP